MAEVPEYFLPHRVEVSAYEGTDAYGEDIYAAPVTRMANVSASKKLVKGTDGTETLVWFTHVIMKPGEGPRPDSRIKLHTGETVVVVSKASLDDGGLGAWQHDEVIA